MTALELAHSRSAEEIDALVAAMEPHLPRILAHTRSHRTRLVKPLLSYDATALALSLVPVAEGPGAEYTYHHLRRDLHDLCTTASLPIASRYVIPSAHISILRFVSSADHSEGGVDTDGAPTDPQKMQRWVTEIERLNGWLEEKFWGQGEGEGEGKGEGEKEKGLDWVVGEGVGLDCRRGTVWYGGGETVALGEGS